MNLSTQLQKPTICSVHSHRDLHEAQPGAVMRTVRRAHLLYGGPSTMHPGVHDFTMRDGEEIVRLKLAEAHLVYRGGDLEVGGIVDEEIIRSTNSRGEESRIYAALDERLKRSGL